LSLQLLLCSDLSDCSFEQEACSVFATFFAQA
jgi:hypothetical protein